MKRRDLERHLRAQGCREIGGSKHAKWRGPENQVSAIPRHKEIGPGLARAICHQLGVLSPPESPLTCRGDLSARVGQLVFLIEPSMRRSRTRHYFGVPVLVEHHVAASVNPARLAAQLAASALDMEVLGGVARNATHL